MRLRSPIKEQSRIPSLPCIPDSILSRTHFVGLLYLQEDLICQYLHRGDFKLLFWYPLMWYFLWGEKANLDAILDLNGKAEWPVGGPVFQKWILLSQNLKLLGLSKGTQIWKTELKHRLEKTHDAGQRVQLPAAPRREALNSTLLIPCLRNKSQSQTGDDPNSSLMALSH